MLLGAIGCMINANFEKENKKLVNDMSVHFSTSMSASGTHFDAILRR